MPQKVRVEYSKTVSRDFNSLKIGAAHEVEVPDGVQFQEAFTAQFAVVKTVVDIAADNVVGEQVAPVVNNNVAQQQTSEQPAEAPGVVEDDFDAEAAFGPEPEWVTENRQNPPPPPAPRSRAPQPPAPRQAAPQPPARPQGAPPPPPPGRARAQAQQQRSAAPPVNESELPQFSDIVEGEPVYYANCLVKKNEDATRNKKQRRLFVICTGPNGFPVSGHDGSGRPYQSANARSFDHAVIADMEAIPVNSKVNIWGTWSGWSNNDQRIQNGEPPMFDLNVEAIEVVQ